MRSILDEAKRFIEDCTAPDSVVCDFTMGNGSDTLYLSRLVPQGRVYAFDVQSIALEHTAQRLREAAAPDNVELILDSHANLDRYLPEEIHAGIFNLGFLPTTDKVVTTKVESTMQAVEKALERLRVGGALVVVVYPGHDEGRREGEAVTAYAQALDARRYDATLYRLVNIPDCPFIVAIEKRR